MFAAACPFAGMAPEKLILAAGPHPKGITIHGLHGAEDATVPPGKGQRTVEILRQAGFSADFAEVPGVGHDFRGAAPQVLKCVEDGIAGATLARAPVAGPPAAPAMIPPP
jgi:predicted esterase